MKHSRANSGGNRKKIMVGNLEHTRRNSIEEQDWRKWCF